MFWKSIYGPLEPEVSLQFEHCCLDHTTNFPVMIRRWQLCHPSTWHGPFLTISVGSVSWPPCRENSQISPLCPPKMQLNASYIVVRIQKNFKEISYKLPSLYHHLLHPAPAEHVAWAACPTFTAKNQHQDSREATPYSGSRSCTRLNLV